MENNELGNLYNRNGKDSESLPRHRWYSFKEAFFPAVVEKAIADAECSQDDLVIDPFCGSGTTPLTTALKTHRSIGIEVNPFLSFVSRTKLLQADVDSMEKCFDAVLEGTKRGKRSYLESFSTFGQGEGKERWLFNTDILRAFEGGWRATSTSNSSPAHDIMRLVLIASAMDNCNAVKDGKCMRYRKDWREFDFGRDSFVTALESRFQAVKADVVDCPIQEQRSTISHGDSRQLLEQVQDKFKLCVTSPPYLNSFDYTDVYRPELFLGRFLKSNSELNSLRQRTIRSHVQVHWAQPARTVSSKLLDKALSDIDASAAILWNKLIPTMISSYFEDMAHVLRILYQKAAPSSTVWFVVSTSAYAGVEIPVDLIIADLANKIGWYMREIIVLRHLRAAGQQKNAWQPESNKFRLRESLIVLHSSPRSSGAGIIVSPSPPESNPS